MKLSKEQVDYLAAEINSLLVNFAMMQDETSNIRDLWIKSYLQSKDNIRELGIPLV